MLPSNDCVEKAKQNIDFLFFARGNIVLSNILYAFFPELKKVHSLMPIWRWHALYAIEFKKCRANHL